MGARVEAVPPAAPAAWVGGPAAAVTAGSFSRTAVPPPAPAQMSVQFSRVYNRRAHATLEDAVEAEWQRRKAANPRLFSALKFRFSDIAGAGGDPAAPPVVHLGLTDYREFIGTNMAAHAATLQADGAAHHGSEDAYMVRLVRAVQHRGVLLCRRARVRMCVACVRLCVAAPGALAALCVGARMAFLWRTLSQRVSRWVSRSLLRPLSPPHSHVCAPGAGQRPRRGHCGRHQRRPHCDHAAECIRG
jgi:hypothetical protein